MKFGLLFIMLAFSSKQKENTVESAKCEKRFEDRNAENLILVKIEEDKCAKVQKKTSQYIGVSYSRNKTSNWCAKRWSKKESKAVYNGYYRDEEIAAHASDTLARKLTKNGEQHHKLNFRDEDTEVHAEKNNSSKYIGVTYNVAFTAKWRAYRWSKKENKAVYNGSYKDEEAAAHASDTLARKLMENGEQNHKLNFPDDNTEVYPEEETTSSIYIGVYYNNKKTMWRAQRRSKRKKKSVYYGSYKDEETAAQASDTLARKLIANDEQNHKLNFPDDTERQTNKRKRSENEESEHSQNK